MTTSPANRQGEAALLLRHVSKTFAGTRALDDVGLEVRTGEVHALVGQNGSGKSTLIKILAGFHQPASGAECSVRGQEIVLGDAIAAHTAGLRFVHQDLGLVPSLNAIDNFALGFGYAGSALKVNWRKQEAAARRALDDLGHPVALHVAVSKLAPVERTAVAVARALQARDGLPSLLVLDEPTATMPKPDVDRLLALVGRLKDANIAVLYVSHHLEEIFRCADRVSILRDGVRVGTEKVSDITHGDLVESMTGGHVEVRGARRAPAASPVVLSARGLEGGRLRGLDLNVHAGEIVGVAGLAGSGREHVCSLIFGGRPRQGKVTVDGSVLPPNRPDQSVAATIGYVPADRHSEALVMSMSIRENLSLPDVRDYRSRSRLRFRHRRERADTRASMARLKVKASSSESIVSTLSGGNQQKVVVGKWLRLQPRVLLLDEPTQGVDVLAKLEIHRLLDAAASAGAAILVASSDDEELANLCHRVVVLRNGVVAGTMDAGSIHSTRITQLSLGYAGQPESKRSHDVAS